MGRSEHGFVVNETGVLADRGFFQSLLVVAVHIGALNQGRKLGRDERAVERLAPTSGVAAVSEDRASIGDGRIGRRGSARSAVEPVESGIERGNGCLNLFRRTTCHRLQDLLRIAVKRQGPVKRANRHLVRPCLVKRDGDSALGDVFRVGRQVKVVVLAEVLHLATHLDRTARFHDFVFEVVGANRLAHHEFVFHQAHHLFRDGGYCEETVSHFSPS